MQLQEPARKGANDDRVVVDLTKRIMSHLEWHKETFGKLARLCKCRSKK